MIDAQQGDFGLQLMGYFQSRIQGLFGEQGSVEGDDDFCDWVGGAHDEYGAGGLAQHFFGDAAQHPACES